MRRMAYQPWFGLPNILSGQFVVPELIQDAATPEALAREGLAWLAAMLLATAGLVWRQGRAPAPLRASGSP